MFTGIIQTISKVKKAERHAESLILTITTPRGWKLKPGDSIATDGACLTVKKVGKGWYQTELMAETLKRTTFGQAVPLKVNLERPLRPSDFLDGHIVQGHVDVVGKILSAPTSPFVPPLKGEGTTNSPTPMRGRIKEGVLSDSLVYIIHFPGKFSKLVVEKGSIAVDGISLTVVDVGKDWFSVALVPYTLEHTTIGEKGMGEAVNLEFDVLGKYVAKLLVNGY